MTKIAQPVATARHNFAIIVSVADAPNQHNWQVRKLRRGLNQPQLIFTRLDIAHAQHEIPFNLPFSAKEDWVRWFKELVIQHVHHARKLDCGKVEYAR